MVDLWVGNRKVATHFGQCPDICFGTEYLSFKIAAYSSKKKILSQNKEST